MPELNNPMIFSDLNNWDMVGESYLLKYILILICVVLHKYMHEHGSSELPVFKSVYMFEIVP